MSETPMVTFSSVDNPITWNIEGESKCLVFASPSEAKRAEEMFTAMQRELAAERERADRSKAEGIKEGLRRAAEMCNAADKSTHPADLADAILKEAGE